MHFMISLDEVTHVRCPPGGARVPLCPPSDKVRCELGLIPGVSSDLTEPAATSAGCLIHSQRPQVDSPESQTLGDRPKDSLGSGGLTGAVS